MYFLFVAFFLVFKFLDNFIISDNSFSLFAHFLTFNFLSLCTENNLKSLLLMYKCLEGFLIKNKLFEKILVKDGLQVVKIALFAEFKQGSIFHVSISGNTVSTYAFLTCITINSLAFYLLEASWAYASKFISVINAESGIVKRWPIGFGFNDLINFFEASTNEWIGLFEALFLEEKFSIIFYVVRFALNVDK